MAERTFLHVGTPKSGTTYLQEVLWRGVDGLRQNNILLPHRFNTHYLAAKGVTERQGLMRDPGADTSRAWPRLARAVNTWDGDAVICHELFAPASVEQATRAKSLLKDTEVHVVLTARALHKQIPASWQEQVKAGLPTTYDAFLDQVRTGEGKGYWFWLVQDMVGIADRWGVDVKPEHVHVVTVPRDASDRTLLWRRFASVLGLDEGSLDSMVPRRNVSLGPVKAELLRRVHAAQDSRFTDPDRHRWTRRLLASRILGRRADDAGRSPRDAVRLPDDVYEWLTERTTTMVDDVRAAGYAVVGDLADLSLEPSPATARLISSVTDDEIEEASDWTIARLQDHLVLHCRPTAPLPTVGPGDGVNGILELLEHIRAADTDATPRSPSRAGLLGAARSLPGVQAIPRFGQKRLPTTPSQ